MKTRTNALGPVLLTLLMAGGCQSSSGGLDRLPPGSGGAAGAPGETGASGGSGGTGAVTTTSFGEGGETASVTSSASGGSGATSSGGSGGNSAAASSGGSGGGSAASGGSGGVPVADCTYSSEPQVPPSAGGQGGAGSEDIHIESSNFVGDYLVDAAGFSLYIYGADYPGDCNNPPVTNCYDDCVLSWPVFDAGPRSLGEGLADEAFGSFQRSDGLWQTTYLGWPLYYYKRDEAPGDLVGQGRGRIWFAAETSLPNIMVMRASEENGGIRYLATEQGFTLYAHASDVAGASPGTQPASACVDACLDDHQPFMIHSLRPASPIDPGQITVFVRPDSGDLQVAYNGVPLYTARADTRSGQLNGAADEAWSIVEL